MELKIIYNASRKCACLTGDYIDIVREHFSIADPGARFARRFGNYRIPSRKYAITASGNFGIGLIPEIIKFCKEKNILYSVDNQLLPLLKPSISDGKLYNVLNSDFKLRDYQENCINQILEHGRGLIKVGTGGGKTLITSTIIENFYQRSKNKENFKCLMIVPDLGLVNQTYNEFNKFGTSFSCSKFTGNNELNLNTHCIIANSQILLTLDKIDWIKNIDLLIVDEVHKIKHGNKITKLVNKIKTLHRIGCTGTLPPDKLDLWGLIGNFGQVIYEKTGAELREEGFLSNVKVNVLKLKYPYEFNGEYNEEMKFLMENKGRNQVIYKLCKGSKNNILVLVNYIEHGEILYNILKNIEDKQIFFVQGSVDVNERTKIIELMENADNVVCIAISAIFSTGINIKNLHNIVFAAGGKSPIRIIQSIGRGLRLHPTKTQCNIIDIGDDLKYSSRQLDERLKIYKSEKIETQIREIVVETI